MKKKTIKLTHSGVHCKKNNKIMLKTILIALSLICLDFAFCLPFLLVNFAERLKIVGLSSLTTDCEYLDTNADVVALFDLVIISSALFRKNTPLLFFHLARNIKSLIELTRIIANGIININKYLIIKNEFNSDSVHLVSHMKEPSIETPVSKLKTIGNENKMANIQIIIM